ncbi:TetR/AcrR family transcriptional regulator [Nocardiopsis composta]
MSSEKTPEPRRRILEAAAGLLAEGGPEAASTRAVAAAAGVQAPTLYRLFGDKQGLLEALAAHGFERYLADKQELGATDDPVADLRRGWDLHVDFGLARPALYVLMYGTPGRAAARPPRTTPTRCSARCSNASPARAGCACRCRPRPAWCRRPTPAWCSP